MDIGLLLFPRLTQLDLTGPFEVFAKTPGARVHLIWKMRGPVEAETGMQIIANETFDDCPPLDVICVPGGPGVNAVMEDEETLDFLREQAAGARFVTSVCTGSLILGAAGLLRGKRATSHWASRDLLARFGAIPAPGRVVRDGKLITGGGVTAGIDFALTVIAELGGDDVARSVQLQIEYAPQPPFDSGTPETAPERIVTAARTRGAAMRREREELADRAAARLTPPPV